MGGTHSRERVPPRLPPMRLAPFALAAVLAVASGCSRGQTTALQGDLERYAGRNQAAFEHLRQSIRSQMPAEDARAQRLALDVPRFLEWRKREWWKLQNEFAVLVAEDWENVERLSVDVSRHFGYEIKNFPKGDDAIAFFAKADDEWRALVTDVAIFIEYQRGSFAGMQKQLAEFYDNSRREAANLRADLKCFFSWRKREYDKLVRDGKDFFAQARWESDRLTLDIERHFMTEANKPLIPVDFALVVRGEMDQVVRLTDDLSRFAAIRQREWELLKKDITITVENFQREPDKLSQDAERFIAQEAKRQPQLMRDIEETLARLRWEKQALTEDAERFWRYEILRGNLFVSDLQLFYAKANVEASELKMDLKRFWAYSGVEAKAFMASLHRFLDDEVHLRGPTGHETPRTVLDSVPPLPLRRPGEE